MESYHLEELCNAVDSIIVPQENGKPEKINKAQALCIMLECGKLMGFVLNQHPDMLKHMIDTNQAKQ